MDIFNRLAPYIQDYIYRTNWTELREIQVAACDVIFNTDKNLILSTGTASGKTEAAFFPTLTAIYEKPASSIGILYISPLKALINDQFVRLNEILAEGNISVCRWHGDSSLSAKNKLINNPKGILQITPESLESLIINKREACIKLFSDLRFIIIDEIHYFMASPRGIQLLSLLERIQKLTNCTPRRIGLSATLSDYSSAENWLNCGTKRSCEIPRVNSEKRILRLTMQCFKSSKNNKKNSSSHIIEHLEYIYRQTLHKKAIIFTKSRAEVELLISEIRQIAAKNHTNDVYRVHHGSISASIREEIEKDMKCSNNPIVTGATVTLELGIDIGSLDRVVQVGSPISASSFTQRIGRCGRRGQPAEIIFTFENCDTNIDIPLLKSIDWEFIKTIAIIELSLKEKWVEPISISKYPYGILYHQTMSFLLSEGEVLPAVLAQNILGLQVFRNIPKNDYQLLLKHLLSIEHLQKTEKGGLIIGKNAEKIVTNYEFFSVFKSSIEYLVKYDSQPIGSVMELYPKGTHFTLAGQAWETINIDKKSKVLFVKPIKGVPKISWASYVQSNLHSKLIQKMKEIISSDTDYTYMNNECKRWLHQIRQLVIYSQITDKLVIPISKHKFALLPWIGTRQLYGLLFLLQKLDIKCIIQPEAFTPIYLEVIFDGSSEELEQIILKNCKSYIDKYNFILPKDIQIPCKYNEFIPQTLLSKQFIEDYIDVGELSNLN